MTVDARLSDETLRLQRTQRDLLIAESRIREMQQRIEDLELRLQQQGVTA